MIKLYRYKNNKGASMGNFVDFKEIEKQNEYVNKVKLLVNGKGKKAFVYTLGCQQNEADSEKIMGTLNKMGYQITENEKDTHPV